MRSSRGTCIRVVGLTLVLGGCSTIVGIGDIPTPEDSGLDAAPETSAGSGSGSESGSGSGPEATEASGSSGSSEGGGSSGDATLDGSGDSTMESSGSGSSGSSGGFDATTTEGSSGVASDSGGFEAAAADTGSADAGPAEAGAPDAGATGTDGGGEAEASAIVLAAGQSNAYVLLTSPVTSSVYWTTNGGTYECAITGCQASPTLFCSAYNSTAIAVDTVNLYGANDIGQVVACDLGNGDTTVLTTINPPPYGIVGDGTNLYWAESTGNGLIKTCPVADCSNPATLATDPSSMHYPWGVATDGANVYWTTHMIGGTGSVVRIGVDGGSTQTLASGQQNGSNAMLETPQDIAVAGGNVYWTNAAGGTVMKCAATGCGGAPTVLAMNQAVPMAIATDGTNVYWTNYGGGTVMKCGVGGCGAAPTTLMSGQAGPLGIAVDAQNVYWTDFGTSIATGTVQFAPK
jgi:hypothetical protein